MKQAIFSYFINKYKEAKATVIVGKEMISPYLEKSKNENLTSYFFNKEENMIPAKAPIGVKKAPILLPIIVE